MRIVVFGAGAVGSLMGARLFQHGIDVTLIARGKNYEAIASRGVTIALPEESINLFVPVVNDLSQISFRDDDVVVLAVKSQDTVDALKALQAVAPSSIPIVCTQNGVENERMTLRRFPNVYAMCVMTPSSYLEPGVVEPRWTAMTGMMDIGRYPSGSDGICVEISSALEKSTYSSLVRDDIIRWKYGKLLRNLGTVVEAVCGYSSRRGGIVGDLVRAEGQTVLDAAGISFTSDAEEKERRGLLPEDVRVSLTASRGNSSWQSLQRGLGSIEADYLNGEIVFLGRQCGVATPINGAIQYFANKMAREHTAPGTIPEEVVIEFANTHTL